MAVWQRRRWVASSIRCAVVLTLVGGSVLACERGTRVGRWLTSAHAHGGGVPRIALDTSQGASAATIVVGGLSDDALHALRDTEWPVAAWTQLLTVTVAGNDSIPVIGRYVVGDTAVEFHPMFPFDAGLAYTVRFDAARIPPSSRVAEAGSSGHSDRPVPIVRAVVALPAQDSTPVTTVVRSWPTSDVVSENLLRVYLQFSAPMSSQSSLGVVTLRDEQGREVPKAFLPLDIPLWDHGHTRYTLLFDPGRVKRGIVTHEQLGRAIRAGHAYTIEVSPAWRDAQGRRLRAPYQWHFRVAVADTTPIVPKGWHVLAPRAGSRDPLVVTFPKPLDYALLQSAVGVEQQDYTALAGDVCSWCARD